MAKRIKARPGVFRIRITKKRSSALANEFQGTFTCREDVYKGYWKDDKLHGKGTCHYASGDVYVGNFENGLPRTYR